MTTPIALKRIDNDTLEAVKRADIVEVISEHVALEKRGKDYMGLCPFHDEKTPSFSVSPTKQLYYCFGCTAGGNAINFIMQTQGKGFTDAVLELARDLGVQVRYEDGTTEGDPPPPRPRRPLAPVPDQPKVRAGSEQDCTFSPNVQFAQLPALATDSPKPQQRKNDTEIIYRYPEWLWVQRLETPDASKPKGYSKITLPWHINDRGKAVKGKGVHPWSPYRMEEVEQYAVGKWLLMLEGEACVESSRSSLGLVASTLQGGSWSADDLKNAMLQYQKAGVAGIVFAPDHDEAGRKKAQKAQKAASLVGLPFITLDPLAIWEEMPEAGDIVDWVQWGIGQGMDRDDFIRRLEESIHAAVNNRLKQQKLNDPIERAKLEIKAWLKETDVTRREITRGEIQARYRLKDAAFERVIRSLDENSRTPIPKDLGFDEILSLPQMGIEYVIPGMLPAGETVLLVADPKAGKSLLAYDAAFAVVTGESHFLGEQTKQGKVLIIQCDESLNTARGRLLKRGFRREDGPNLRIMDSFNISQLDLLEEKLESFRPTLVIIDSLRRINAGREVSENSAEFADNIYQLKELCGRYNSALLLIHHSSKNQEAVGVGRVRGSSAIAGAVWGVWQLDQIPKPDPNNKKRLIIDPKDQTRILSIIARDVEGQRLKIELDPENNHWISHGEEGADALERQERQTIGNQIVTLLQSVSPKGLEASEIKEALKVGSSIYPALNRLVGKRVIGSRPSSKDRRRTVYFYPTGSDGNESDTPPPTPTDSLDRESTQSVVNSSVTDSISNPNPSISNPYQPTQEIEDETASGDDAVMPSAFDINSQVFQGRVDAQVVAEGSASPAPFSSEELAEMLLVCDCAEAVAGLRQVPSFTPELLNEACKRLSPEKHAQIKAWVIELNSRLKVGNRVFVNSCPHTDRLGPYLIEWIDNDGGIAKVEGFADPIALVDLRKATE
jgi:archaellum biogenesis ATPase FlaH